MEETAADVTLPPEDELEVIDADIRRLEREINQSNRAPFEKRTANEAARQEAQRRRYATLRDLRQQRAKLDATLNTPHNEDAA